MKADRNMLKQDVKQTSSELSRALRRLRLWRRLQPLINVTGGVHSREIFYQGMVYQSALAMDLHLPPLYPVHSAANYGLLYILMRAVTEMGCSTVLELGAGQTTRFLDSLQVRKPEMKVVTLESNKEWHEKISKMVSHEVFHQPLVRRNIAGIEVDAYVDLTPLKDTKFDLVLVDGPHGSKRNSRWTSLEILSGHLAEEFIVIFDDAERIGEQDTIRQFMQSYIGKIEFSTVTSMKCQFVAFSPKFRAAKYL